MPFIVLTSIPWLPRTHFHQTTMFCQNPQKFHFHRRISQVFCLTAFLGKFHNHYAIKSINLLGVYENELEICLYLSNYRTSKDDKTKLALYVSIDAENAKI